MIEWEPITEAALRARMAQGEARMGADQRRLWHAIRIEPEKWQQHPRRRRCGLLGGRDHRAHRGLVQRHRGRLNRGNPAYGTIDDYWCNDDELEVTVQYLISAIELAPILLPLRAVAFRPPR